MKKTMTIKIYYEILKAIIFGLIIVALVVGGLKGYAWVDMRLSHQEAQNKIELENARKYKVYDAEAAANLARANTVIGSLKSEVSRLQKIADTKNHALQEALADIKKNNEVIFNLGETVASLNDNIRKLNTKSSHEYKAGTGDPNEQYFVDIMYPIKNKDGTVEREVPYAWAIFYPNRPAATQWKYGIYPLDYHVRTIQTKQEDGQINTYNEVWFENNHRKMSKGVEVPVKISSSEFTQSLNRESQFYWWAPHVNLNLDLNVGKFDNGTGYIRPGISFSTSGYGRTTNDLIWRFVDFGISTNGNETYFKFTPFTYNLGENLPLISNTFIGPFVGYSTEGKVSFGAGISIPF